jgi:serine/threonine protein kinase
VIIPPLISFSFPCFGINFVLVTSNDSMFEWLAQRAGENIFTAAEQVIFWTKFAGYAVPLREKKLSIVDARSLVKRVCTVLRSQTTSVMMAVGFVFDGLLGQTGGGKALLYHVIELATGEVKCGKVYRVDKETEATVSAEVEGSTEVHEGDPNPHIVRYEHILPFHHESGSSGDMVVLIMPLFQMSLATILDAFFETPLPLNMFCKVATCVLGAGARFHELEKGHCDIKPENIMMAGGIFTLIDLGAVCKYGAAATECTPGYYLDAPVHSVSPIFDLNCAAVTLARCCIGSFKVARGMTKAQLSQMIKGLSTSALEQTYADVIEICLSSDDSKAAYAALARLLG